jgi:hypothetical protein
MIKYPCKDCTDRVLGCHSTCQKYMEAKAKNSVTSEAIHKEKNGLDDYGDYVFRVQQKIIKRYGTRRRGD